MESKRGSPFCCCGLWTAASLPSDLSHSHEFPFLIFPFHKGEVRRALCLLQSVSILSVLKIFLRSENSPRSAGIQLNEELLVAEDLRFLR